MKWKLNNGAAQRRRGVKASVATTEALALQRSGKLAWVMPSKQAIMKENRADASEISRDFVLINLIYLSDIHCIMFVYVMNF